MSRYQSQTGSLADFDAIALEAQIGARRHPRAPIVDGQVMASQNGANAGVLVHGIRPADLANVTVLVEKLSPARSGSSRAMNP